MESTCARIPSLLREAVGRTVGQTELPLNPPSSAQDVFYVYFYILQNKRHPENHPCVVPPK